MNSVTVLTFTFVPLKRKIVSSFHFASIFRESCPCIFLSQANLLYQNLNSISFLLTRESTACIKSKSKHSIPSLFLNTL